MDWLRAPVRDVIKPFRDSNIEVTREWYPVPRGTPSLGFAHAFGSAHWEPFPYLPRNVGEVFPSQYEFIRRETPSDMPFDHVCGTQEDFQLGAVYNPDLTPVEYDADGIPKCCGRPNMCICTEEEITAAGSTQALATAITASNVRWASQSTTRGIRLPSRVGAVVWLYDAGGSFGGSSARLYPPSGEQIDGTTAADLPLQIGPGTLYQGQLVCIRTFRTVGPALWRVIPFQNAPEFGEIYTATLAASFTITGATGVYQATGLTIQLPLPGRYRISGQIQATVNPNAAGAHTIDVRLRDQTGAVNLVDSESRICRSDQVGIPANLTGALEAYYDTGIACTVELMAARTGTAWNNSQVVSASTGRTKLIATRLWGRARGV